MIRHPGRPGFEEEFAHPLEEEDGAVGGLRHEFYLSFPPCAFMAAGSVAERERFEPRKPNPSPPLLRAGCKGIYPIDCRQRSTLGVGATNGDVLLAEPVPVTVFLTMRVSGG